MVTLVDGRNILKSLDDTSSLTSENPVAEADGEEHEHRGPQMTTAHLQISHADVVVINKSDLVTEAELDVVKQRVRGINGLAKVHVTSHSRVPQLEGLLLDLHAYDGVGNMDFAAKGHSHLDPVGIPAHDAHLASRPHTHEPADNFHNHACSSASQRLSAAAPRCLASLCLLGLPPSSSRLTGFDDCSVIV